MRAALAALLALATDSTAAAAVDCPQERAIYGDEAGIYTLTFQPVDPESSAATHRFSLKAKDSAVTLDGYVMTTEPVARPQGMLFYNCPEGDATGADLAACTVWQDILYGTSGGKIVALPAQGESALSELLLPGFAPSLQASSAWGQGKLAAAPPDVLALKGCGS